MRLHVQQVKKRNTRYLKRNQKFGMALPKSVEEARELDRQNGNTLWMGALQKEMRNTKVVFKMLEDGENAPRHHQFVKCHAVWDARMRVFRRKPRLVAGGHTTTA